MWGRRKSSERPPWYRASGYRGKLTEAEKRELDAFRAQPSHPAFEYGELPEHVEMYISGLEIEAYDLKQARAFGRALTCSLIGAAVLYATHFRFQSSQLDLGLRIRDSAPDRPVDRLPLRDSKDCSPPHQRRHPRGMGVGLHHKGASCGEGARSSKLVSVVNRRPCGSYSAAVALRRAILLMVARLQPVAF